MKLYRVTDLANGGSRREVLPWGVHLAAMLGTNIHIAISKQYEGMGRFLEKQQIGYLCPTTKKGAPIWSILCGTPDMFWLEDDVLKIVDFKTLNPKSKVGTKQQWWTQLSLYALLIQTNYKFKVKSVDLEIWIYHRYDSMEESIKRVKVIKESRQITSLLATVELWISNYFKKQLKLISWKKGVIGNECDKEPCVRE